MIAYGTVISARAAVIEARIPGTLVGDGVRIACSRGALYGTIGALSGDIAFVMPCGAVEGVGPGDAICTDAAALEAPLGVCALGRAFDAGCQPIDGGSPLRASLQKIDTRAPAPGKRRAIQQPFWTGVCAIDALLTAGTGARIGIFGPAGAGKSKLLHALMRGAQADAVVVGLVGERGREAEEWLRARTPHASIFCATGDRAAVERAGAARLAMAQANALRSRGLDVLLILDSFARLAAAHREIAIACGESVGRGGYPARVFAELAAFAEIAGKCERGSITLFATILSDGDERDPVSEAARALLDGHIQLSAELANAGRFPAIDVLASVSRTMNDVVGPEHQSDAASVRAAIAELDRTKDARAIGIIPAITAQGSIESFLRQTQTQAPAATLAGLRELAAVLKEESWSFQPG